MADYWIKLYHEIIDDPKMATLPDRLWRRTIELFLLAGKLSANKSGELPDTQQLAWLLRLSPEMLQSDLAELSSTGIVRATPTGWIIANFEKRQKAVDSTERSKKFRERKQNEKYYGNETSLQRNVAQINRLTDNRLTETEQIKPLGGVDTDYGKLAIAYTENIGDITEFMAQDLQADLDQYGLAACMDALTAALRNNVPKWSYVQGILKRGGSVKIKAKTPKPKSHTIKQMDGTIQEIKV